MTPAPRRNRIKRNKPAADEIVDWSDLMHIGMGDREAFGVKAQSYYCDEEEEVREEDAQGGSRILDKCAKISSDGAWMEASKERCAAIRKEIEESQGEAAGPVSRFVLYERDRKLVDHDHDRVELAYVRIDTTDTEYIVILSSLSASTSSTSSTSTSISSSSTISSVEFLVLAVHCHSPVVHTNQFMLEKEDEGPSLLQLPKDAKAGHPQEEEEEEEAKKEEIEITSQLLIDCAVYFYREHTANRSHN